MPGRVAGGGGEFLAEVEEQRVDEGAAVVVERAGAGVHHHARSLVDDREVVVLVDDVEREVFGFGAKGGGLGIAFDVDLLAAAKLVARLGDGAVDGDLAVVDEQLHAAAADVREGFGEIGVDTHFAAAASAMKLRMPASGSRSSRA